MLSPGHDPRHLTLEWDGEASAVAVRIPDDVRTPFLVTFTLDNKIPEEEKAKKPPQAAKGEKVEHEDHPKKSTKTVVGKIDVCAAPLLPCSFYT